MGRHSTGHHLCYDHHLRRSHTPPMSERVLIVGTEPAAKTPAEIATSLRFTPVIAGSEEEALGLLDQESFSLIAVSGAPASRRLRDAAERTQPAARLLELPG